MVTLNVLSPVAIIDRPKVESAKRLDDLYGKTNGMEKPVGISSLNRQQILNLLS